MPNTDRYQSLPDFFASREEGKAVVKENTNPRYKFFRQVHFTAGDYEQFLQFWDNSSHEKEEVERLEDSLLPPQVNSPLFKDVSTDDVFGTFEYIFHKFKKGIFVKFVQNELKVFLPFSKVDYTNEWSDRIYTDTKKYKDLDGLFEQSSHLTGFKLDKKKIHYMKDHWYGNNGLLRNEYPICENDSGISTLRDMMICLAKERSVPDCEFFLNKRDFPILKNDHTEPYECIFGNSHPLVSFDREVFCPILGMTSTDRHSDIPIPTWEDWARVEFFDNKLFGKEFSSFPDPFIPFSQKEFPTAVFRGASTGLGTTTETNPRLFFSLLSKQQNRDTDGHLFLDCGITKWNCRPRRHSSDMPYGTFDSSLKESIGTTNFLSMSEQARYKYILHLPGHSQSYRLSYELATGSVLLMWPTAYQLWFSHLLQPYVHYVPIETNIFDTIRWCKQNEEKCADIATQARAFYEKYLQRDSILDYWQTVLCRIQTHSGKIHFPKKDMSSFQQEIQKRILSQETLRLQATSLPEKWQHINGKALHPCTFQKLLYQIDPKILLEQIHQAPVHKESRNVLLKKIEVFGRILCIKSPKTPSEKDLLHETFIGQIGTNKIANVLPSIAFLHGRWGDHLVMDFIDGETFEHAIQKQTSTKALPFFLSILVQILFTLSFLQNELGFLHFDLYPWNIIIRKNKEKKIFHFPLQNGKCVSFCPEEYPVIIDMGKSHLVHDNIHFVNVAPFRLHFYQDVISILVSGIFQVLHHHKISNTDAHKVLRIFHHLAPSSYTSYKPISNLTQLKHFIRVKKKFSNMLLDEKKEFQYKHPLEFFTFLYQQDLCPPLPGMRFHKKESDLLVQSEVLHSRYFIEHQIFSSLGIETSLLFEAFQKERLSSSHKSVILTAYSSYINLKILRLLFPSREKEKNKLIASIQPINQLEWTNESPSPPIQKTPSLPRFFSHPDPKTFLQIHPPSDNMFIHRHKILFSLVLASQEIQGLETFQEKIYSSRKDYLYHPFLRFSSISVSSHLSKYKQWLDGI